MSITVMNWELMSKVGPSHCGHCGDRMVPYVKTCARCEKRVSTSAPPRRALNQKPPATRRIAHLSDLHVGKVGSGGHFIEPIVVLREWLKEFRTAAVDVVVISGDLVDKATDESSLRAVKSALEDSKIPWVVVPGNHDIEAPGRNGRFEHCFGTYPRREVKADVPFLLLDSNAGLPQAERSVYERIFQTFFCPTEGAVGEKQTVDVMRDATPSAFPHVLVLHHHLIRQQADPVINRITWLKEDMIGTMEPLRDAEYLRVWAVKQGVRLVLHGHKHAMQGAGYHGDDLLVLNGGSSTKSLGEDPSIRRYLARTVDLFPTGEREITTLQLAM